VTSLSVRKFGDSEIVGHVGYEVYSALQLKVSLQFSLALNQPFHSDKYKGAHVKCSVTCDIQFVSYQVVKTLRPWETSTCNVKPQVNKTGCDARIGRAGHFLLAFIFLFFSCFSLSTFCC